MTDNHRQRRQNLYFKLSSEIAQISDEQLRPLLDISVVNSGWGRNQVLDIGRSKVFVKRVPVTDLEYSNMFSTKNFYDLPTFYNYGFGSAGLGVFRELVTHIKTTNWVLSGEFATFPLMYHYRIVPFVGTRAELDQARHKRVVEYWGSSDNVGRYLLDRVAANYELVLFLEYIPYTVATWLLDNPTKIPIVMTDIQAAITFLRAHGIIHLDAHFSNMLTDGKHVYLTDFGLALDKHFELTPAEKQFYKQNSYYDYGVLIWSVGAHVFRIYRNLLDAGKTRILERYGLPDAIQPEQLVPILLSKIDDLSSSGLLNIDTKYINTLTKYRSIISLIQDFYLAMRENNAKDTPFNQASLKRMLLETDFIPRA